MKVGKLVAPHPQGHTGGNQVLPQGEVLEWAADLAGAEVLGPCTLVLTLRPGEQKFILGSQVLSLTSDP